MLNAKNFGLAAGILWGLAIFVWTFITLATGLFAGFMGSIGLIYPGYSVSVAGAFIGLVYGFIDAGVCFFIFASLYNWLEAREKK